MNVDERAERLVGQAKREPYYSELEAEVAQLRDVMARLVGALGYLRFTCAPHQDGVSATIATDTQWSRLCCAIQSAEKVLRGTP